MFIRLLVFVILTMALGNLDAQNSIKDMNENFSDSSVTVKQYEGKIVKLQQMNKRGRKLPTQDFFFEIDGKQYFVKSAENTVNRKELEARVMQTSDGCYISGTVKIEGELKSGLWDTDDPRQQSRIGEYIHIYKIIE